MQGQPQPGWYPDPEQPGRERWWSGTQWRDQWRSAAAPLPLPPGPPLYPAGPTHHHQPPARRGRGCLFTMLSLAIAMIVIIIITIVIIARGSSSKQPGIGTGSHPAAGDISITSCAVDPTSKVPHAAGTIDNHSSRPSEYTFTIWFVNTGGTVVAQGGGMHNNIAPHHTAPWSTNADSQVATGPVTCKMANVTRFASP